VLINSNGHSSVIQEFSRQLRAIRDSWRLSAILDSNVLSELCQNFLWMLTTAVWLKPLETWVNVLKCIVNINHGGVPGTTRDLIELCRNVLWILTTAVWLELIETGLEANAHIETRALQRAYKIRSILLVHSQFLDVLLLVNLRLLLRYFSYNW